MSFERGSRVGPYEIVSQVGEGGMGTVFRARDLRLDRSVAIKVFKQDFTERFEREARAISALNHPNICTLHDVGREGETPFLVMEFVDGEPLHGPIPLTEAVNLALQILDALGLAHKAGIIHRDLKPANILHTKSGVKLLDFGLAKKITSREAASELTLTMHQTQEQTIVGTLQYMAPEQLEGKEADVRSDVFAFGCLFYEMLTGHRVFSGDTPASIIAAVMSSEPRPIGDVGESAGKPMEMIIRRCLEKRPEDRWQTAQDLLAALKLFAMQAGIQRRPESKAIGVHRWASMAMPVLLVLALAGGWWVGTSMVPKISTSGLRFIPLGTADEMAMSPSWSSDGRFVVYAAMRNGRLDIFQRELERGVDMQITSSPANENDPVLSPDGRVIAMSSDEGGGGIFLVPSGGGVPSRLTSFGAHPVWSPGGEKVTFDWSGAIYEVPANGGEPRRLLGGTGGARPYMTWAAGGKKMLLWHRVRSDILVLDISSGEFTPLKLIPPGEEVNGLSLSPDEGTLIYSRGPMGGNKELWLAWLSPGTLLPEREPVRLTLSLTDASDCRFSPDGKQLLFCLREVRRHLWSFPLDPQQAKISGNGQAITHNGERNYYPAVSPDGNTLIWTSQSGDNGVLFFRRLGTQEELRLSPDSRSDARQVLAAFSPDSQQVAYASTAGGSFQIWRMPALQGVSLRLTENSPQDRDTWPAWSQDGKQIAFHSTRGGSFDVWIVSPDGSGRRKVTDSPANESRPLFSPDGRHLAFLNDRAGNSDIWAANLATGKQAPLVEGPAEEGPFAWSGDGHWLYFVSTRGGAFDIWAQPAGGGEPAHRVLASDIKLSLPEDLSFSKFAIAEKQLIAPMETRRTRVYLLEQLPLRP